MATYSSPSPPLGSAAASYNAAANEADAATTTTAGDISPASAAATRADERLSVMMRCATLVAASLLAVAAFPRAPLVTLGWASYLICWTPGCGLVAHGWEQLGSDRWERPEKAEKVVAPMDSLGSPNFFETSDAQFTFAIFLI